MPPRASQNPDTPIAPRQYLLALAGSAYPASVALLDCGAGAEQAAFQVFAGQTGEQLLVAVAQWVDTWGVPAYLALDVGPGSFTGLRMGLGLAQGLALAWGRTVLAANSAQIMASWIPWDHPWQQVITLRDARMGAVYLGEHRPGSLTSCTPEPVIEVDPQEAVERIRAAQGQGSGIACVVDKALVPVLQRLCHVPGAAEPCDHAGDALGEALGVSRLLLRAADAAQLARLASARIAAGDFGMHPTALKPFYVRNDVAMDLAAQRAYRLAKAS